MNRVPNILSQTNAGNSLSCPRQSYVRERLSSAELDVRNQASDLSVEASCRRTAVEVFDEAIQPVVDDVNIVGRGVDEVDVDIIMSIPVARVAGVAEGVAAVAAIGAVAAVGVVVDVDEVVGRVNNDVNMVDEGVGDIGVDEEEEEEVEEGAADVIAEAAVGDNPADEEETIQIYMLKCRELTRKEVVTKLKTVLNTDFRVSPVRSKNNPYIHAYKLIIFSQSKRLAKLFIPILYRLLCAPCWLISGRTNRLPKKRAERVGDKLRIMSFNINHLYSKYATFVNQLCQENIDVFCLQETVCKNDSRTFVRDYTCIEMKVDEGVNNRGLLIGVANDSGFEVTKIQQDYKNILVAELSGVAGEGAERRAVRYAVVNVYIPHATESKAATKREVEEVCRKLAWDQRYSNVIVAGDFNMSVPQVNKFMQRSGSGVRRVGIAGKTTLRSHKKTSTIDHICCLNISHVSGYVVDRCMISDHFPLVIDMPICPVIPPQDRKVIRGVKVSKMSDDELHTVISHPCWQEPVNEDNWSTYFTNNAWQVAEEVGVVVNVSAKRRKFMVSRKLKKIIHHHETNKKHYLVLMESIRREGGENEESNIKLLKETYDKEVKKMKRLIKRAQKEQIDKELIEQAQYITSNEPSKAWKFIKKFTTTRSDGVKAVYSPGTTDVVSDPTAVAQICTEHCARLASDVSGNSRNPAVWPQRYAHMLQGEHPPVLDGCDTNITIDEVRRALATLKNNKAAGPDGIPNELLKCALNDVYDDDDNQDLSPMFLRIYDMMCLLWDKGVIPDALNESNVVLIHKANDIHNLNNYRGIALMNTITKLMSCIVMNRIMSLCSTHNLLIRGQAGFRPKEECLMQIASLIEICGRRSVLGLPTYVVYVDFEKAYDSLPQEAILCKLKMMGIGGKLNDMIRALYANPTISVSVGSHRSDKRPYLKGVRQGDPCSPILFNLFINDILDGMATVDVPGTDTPISGLLFADDLALVANSLEDMKSNLAKLYDWCDINEMKVNVAKCGYMVVRKFSPAEINDPNISQDVPNRTDLVVPVRVNNVDTEVTIPYTDSYKYLGLDVNHSIDMHVLSQTKVARLRKAKGGMYSMLRGKRVHITLKMWAIRSVLLPIASYGAELFGTSQTRLDKSMTVINDALRLATGVSKSTIIRALAWSYRIPQLSLVSRLAVIRAKRKWPRSTLYISDLMKYDAFNGNGIKYTLIHNMYRWVSTYAVEPHDNVTDSVKLLRMKSANIVAGRVIQDAVLSIDERPGYVYWQEVQRDCVQGSSLLCTLFSWYPVLISHVCSISRIVCGSMTTVNTLIRAGLVEAQHRDTCPCCRSHVVDSVAHYILDCEAFEADREEYLSDVIDEVKVELLAWLPIITSDTHVNEVDQLHNSCKQVVDASYPQRARRRRVVHVPNNIPVDVNVNINVIPAQVLVPNAHVQAQVNGDDNNGDNINDGNNPMMVDGDVGNNWNLDNHSNTLVALLAGGRKQETNKPWFVGDKVGSLKLNGEQIGVEGSVLVSDVKVRLNRLRCLSQYIVATFKKRTIFLEGLKIPANVIE